MTPEEIKALQDKLAALEAENRKLKESPAPKPADPPPTPPKPDDLKDKADNERKEREAKDAEGRRMESAIAFNMGLKDFVSGSKGLLPETMQGIIDAADKEKYGTQLEKANAIRSGVILEFFSIEANVDLLTASQKEQLKAFQALTKNTREERVESYYNNVFDPAYEMKKRIEKAKELAKAEAGISTPSNTEDAFVKRMSKLSRQTYLGEKEAV